MTLSLEATSTRPDPSGEIEVKPPRTLPVL